MLQNVYNISLIFNLKKKSVLIFTTTPPSSLHVCSSIYLSIVAVAAVVISGQEPVILDSVRTEVTHPLGSPLIFKCNLDTTGNQIVWVDWYFNPSGDLFNESTLLDPKNRSTKTSTAMPDKRKVDDKDDEQILYNHTLGAKYNDSGWYFCKVRKEIPILKDYVSNGTKVVISKYYMLQINLLTLNYKSPYLMFISSILMLHYNVVVTCLLMYNICQQFELLQHI